MKIITINLPPAYIAALQLLVDLGIYPSRSEAVRIALRDCINDDLLLKQDLEEMDDTTFRRRS